MQPGCDGKPTATPLVARAAARQEGIGEAASRSGRPPLIAVVGPCAAGKTLLVRALRARGYDAHEVAQEHSYAPTMWQHITRPDLLIYLDVSWEVARQRRPGAAGAECWVELVQRLQHARQHADLILNTDSLTPQDVLDRTLAFLASVASWGR